MIEEDAGAAADVAAARERNAQKEAEAADQAAIADEQLKLEAADQELHRVEAEEQAKLDAANEELMRVEAEEQAKFDAANEELMRVEAEEQAKFDAANEELMRVEAEEQAKLDAANEELMRVEAEERAASETLERAQAEAAGQQAQGGGNLNLTQLTVAVTLIAAVIAGIALQRSRSSRSAVPSRVAPLEVSAPVQPTTEASIEVNATESDGRSITFRSTVKLTRALNFDPDLRGKGTGPYREQFISDQCDFTISWVGDVDVDVVASPAQREVVADIGGPVTQQGDWPGESCLNGTYYAPNRSLPARLGYSCRFDNVDFRRGGVYRGPPPEDSPNPYGCTLNIKPLASAP